MIPRAKAIGVDANASAPVNAAAWAAYAAAAADCGDVNAGHAAGARARCLLEEARLAVAAYLGASADEIVFVSGGTEANAWGLLGYRPDAALHCVTSTIEHAAVGQTLQHRPQAETLRVAVARHGQMQVADFVQALRPDTGLASLVLACNETGVLQPVQVIAQACRARGVLMHTDAVQAVGRMPVNVRALGVDLLALSGHKLGAVGGIGVLYVRRGVHLQAPFPAAPPNVAGAVSLAAALTEAPSPAQHNAVQARRDTFEAALKQGLDAVEIIGQSRPRLPNTSCVRLSGCAGDGVMMALDIQGFCVSTGSACSSGSIEPSAILLAMGLSRQEAKETVRFSFHPGETPSPIALAERVVAVCRRMRAH